MKSIAFHNLGCKVNGYEMEFMQQALREKGYPIVSFDEKADIYIINTCTVTNIADRKSRQMIHRAKAKNPDAVVVAVGCYVQAGKDEALKDEGIDLAVGNNRKKDLAAILEEYLSGRQERIEKGECGRALQKAAIIDISQTAEYEDMKIGSAAEHTRAFVKVQDGCNQFCSYCIIPHVRGRIRSRELEDAKEEVKRLAGQGYGEIVLTGIHLSSYGMSGGNDFSQSRLLELIRSVAGEAELPRIRLGSLEPRIITEEFIKGLKDCPGLCPHFHLSLQSGCDSVLKRMNRKYSAEEYYEKVCMLREAFGHPAITTDVIVGFPGETPEEFLATKEFVRKAGFYEMHVFKYSRRKGTAAAAMEGQIPEEIKSRRSNELLTLGREMSGRYRKMHLHKQTEVVFEEEKETGGRRFLTGFTREYIRAALPVENLPAVEKTSGLILKGELTEFLEPDILLFRL